MKLYFFIQARQSSTRFPGKVLAEIGGGLRMVDLLFSRIQESRFASPESTVFLIPGGEENVALEEYLRANKYRYMLGDESHVFRRFHEACQRFRPDYFFRICADNPFLEPAFLDRLAEVAAQEARYDYLSYRTRRGTPVILGHFGFFAELIRTAAFLELDPESVDASTREHVTPVFYRHPQRYQLYWEPVPAELDREDIRLTVDRPEDLLLLRKIFEKVGPNFNIYDVYRAIDGQPEWLMQMKRQIERNRK